MSIGNTTPAYSHPARGGELSRSSIGTPLIEGNLRRHPSDKDYLKSINYLTLTIVKVS